MNTTRDKYSTSRVLYIIEAAVEYFIAILVGTTYLAKLCSNIGISDSTTGILTSFISLGFGFQFFALFIPCRNGSKRLVTLLAVVNQAAFCFLYLVPVFDISKNAKTAIFIILLLLAEIVKNLACPIQSTWLVNLIDDNKRGVFTAKKEIVSLISGMFVSLFMGRVIDSFEEKGDLNTAFILGGITLFVLVAIHTTLLLLIKERPIEMPTGFNAKTQFKQALTNKNLLAIIPLFVIYNMAAYSTTPFYGTYQINDLKFSMTFVAVLSIMYAIVRALVSIPMGKLADKYSFATMLNLCYAISAAAYCVNIFTNPSNGKVMYTIYYCLTAISMAGINSAASNLVYDYVPRSLRTGAFAVKNTFAGFAGFFTTLAFSPLLAHIQANGNSFLGIENVYGQQVLSAIGAFLKIMCIVYLNLVVKKLEKPMPMANAYESTAE